jgi:hypothetical protein
MKEFIKENLGKIDLMKVAVGITILAVFGFLVMKLISHQIPDENREIVIHVVGMVEGALSILVGYYFGSSKGSQNKDKMLAESLPPKAGQ